MENGDQDVGLKLFNGTTEVWTQRTGKVSDAGKALFKDRLTVEKSVTYLKATIKNVDFNDSTIELRITGAIIDSGFTKLSDIDSSISLMVQGGPFYCGDKLKSKYIVGMNATTRLELCIQSNPAPEISYTFPSSSGSSLKGSVTGPRWDNKYTIEFELPPIAAVNCGRELLYTITSPTLQGSIPLTGKSRLTLTNIPLDIAISSFSYENKVPKVTWREIKSGLCSNKIAYYIEVFNQTATIIKGPVTGTSLLIDDMGQEPKLIVMWAEYDSPTGRKTGAKSVVWFTKTTTTTTTTTTTIKPGILTTSVPSATKDEKGLWLGIGIVIGLVIGLLLALVIFHILRFYQRQNNTKGNQPNELTEKGPTYEGVNDNVFVNTESPNEQDYEFVADHGNSKRANAVTNQELNAISPSDFTYTKLQGKSH
uniref:Uncharacterized protein n=1 Tax=Clytia hemisphaerica TaxID=252671 RepID=A0A7M6DQ07_9CNID